jgi:hypothetical protein
MSAVPDPSPVLVVGSPRSGGRLLSWGLAQHPRLQLLHGGGWFGSFAASLGPVYRRACSTEGRREGEETPEARALLEPGRMREFLEPFEHALLRALEAVQPVSRRSASRSPHGNEKGYGRGTSEGNGVRSRWVVGAPANVFHAWAISRLLPSARFIHVIRDADAVIRHLTRSRTPDSSYFTEETAAEAWLRHVRAGLLAEAALGPHVVLRLLHRELVEDPETGLRRCLDFLEEPFHEPCLRPFRGIHPDPALAPRKPVSGTSDAGDGASPRSVVEARRLSRSLLLAGAGAGEGGRPSRAGGVGGSATPRIEAGRRLEEEFLGKAAEDEEVGARGSPVARLHGMVRAGVPEGATVAVVSRGDDKLIRLPGRTGWHFPRTEEGVYAGHHPADSQEAVRHLEEVRRRGAEFLLIPCTAFWWLEHYDGLRRHLEDRARLVAFHEDICLLFALPPATHADAEDVGRARVASTVPAARAGIERFMMRETAR